MAFNPSHTKWNWQQKDWPNFSYQNTETEAFEARFIQASGLLLGALKHINTEQQQVLRIELLGDEAVSSSEIEGEYLNRASVQSSIRRQFGLQADQQKILPAEQGIAEVMVDLYQHFADPLSHNTLYQWHTNLMQGRQNIEEVGCYRTHNDPMRVVSGYVHKPNIHFEAPPAKKVAQEMEHFIVWFNRTAPNGTEPLAALIRSAITHLYFVSIHPFEDGNGRIARALAEKALSQSLQKPTLIALSKTIARHRKEYYQALEKNNKSMEITNWIHYFSHTILEAQQFSVQTIDFLIEKTRLFDGVRDQLNSRQEKVISRLFRAGVDGFEGGLSAEKYISITRTSRATATRDLQGLVELGVLIKTGERKSTRYRLNVKYPN